jgi:Spy/CpxP family protein refolding chaperone
MKLQLTLLFSGAIAMIAFAKVLPAQASTVTLSHKVDISTLDMTKNGRASLFSTLDSLNLSASQERQVEALRSDMYSQLSSILTSSQLQTFTNAMNSGDAPRSTLRSLGLNRSQMSSLRGVMTSFQNDLRAILTPDQRAQLEGSRPRNR